MSENAVEVEEEEVVVTDTGDLEMLVELTGGFAMGGNEAPKKVVHRAKLVLEEIKRQEPDEDRQFQIAKIAGERGGYRQEPPVVVVQRAIALLAACEEALA